jgi:ABC-type multidrug transport system fused ATPase/permease subunit
MPYKADRLFENLMDQNSSLRLFLYSPVEQAVNFAARAVPFVRPQPKLVDEVPMMTPLIPAGLPTLKAAGLQVEQTLLLGISATLLLVVSLAHQFSRRGPGENRPVVSFPVLSVKGDGAAPRGMKSVDSAVGERMVQVKNLSKRFGPATALDNLSFEIQAGEAVALWGANGAGKTTALRCRLGVIPYEGMVRLGDYHSTWQGKAVRRLLGFVPQEINFHDDLTVRETLSFYRR